MCADALPIQPVVLSRDREMPAMGIESSRCRWRTVWMVVLPSCSVPSAVVGAGLAG
jgi:hypothetical protein